MGIEHLGVQGQELSPGTVPLIKELRRLHPDKSIQVDGGVRKDNALTLAHAGANRLIAGSAVFGKVDPGAAYAVLKREANR
jgi:ribulose-phosphate 3-epimerase